jgi:hypothetical protein
MLCLNNDYVIEGRVKMRESTITIDRMERTHGDKA